MHPENRATPVRPAEDPARFSRLPSASSRRVIDQPIPITAMELALLQNLSQPDLVSLGEMGDLPAPSDAVWQTLERLLRQYAQYHFERSIRSAVLIDTCFCLSSQSSLDT